MKNGEEGLFINRSIEVKYFPPWRGFQMPALRGLYASDQYQQSSNDNRMLLVISPGYTGDSISTED